MDAMDTWYTQIIVSVLNVIYTSYYDGIALLTGSDKEFFFYRN